MDKFSLYSYTQLPVSLKVEYNKALAHGLTSILEDIKKDGDLNISLIEEFVVSSGQSLNSSDIVEDLYSQISSGIQVGSGNQNLFLGILSKYTACWETINRS